ncbi:alpha-L-fucosidase [Fulvivirgaceae bacterium BMA12]|uniref:alpha-L-fucosidase n=1 Tax=Agaribacillus aureus TaxID=3051825 RepID=A0ABT8L552_9BACT|nr:alpha-L-fucosidase [Fulvivirgaceae bacterium BMA12]
MKVKLLFSLLMILAAGTTYAQKKYQPNWESLDSRPTPQWFEEAKFGIFIHWGPYSVPAWSPKGTYSEWYQYWMQTKGLFGNGNFKGDEVYNYHVKTYGEDFDYYRFGEQFTADLFDPDQWAALFEEAGAKYVVITSKHHDGYTLWPNKEANDRGFAWNSVEIGSKRDLLGDLTAAVKKTDVKMGFYYSLYEWFHPWWQNDRPRFVTDHFHPQFKDLIESYQPDIVWGDGEWEMPAEDWKTPELLAWLFNESSVKDKIVINDRWGKGIRKKHGGYFTTEYEAGANFSNPWEECRGMGFSFGYNQNEDAEDYNSPQTLILMLVNVVSSGGNLLLDIGPDGRGKIPPIMQERLRQMGQWLKINGEAIYGTKTWKKPFQWTAEGSRDFKPEKQHYTGGDFILKLTVDPEPGYAAKEIFFTQKAGNLYLITPKWPSEELVVRDVNATRASKITLLSTNQALSWENKGNDLVIKMPAFDPNTFSDADHYAFVFKITAPKQ